MSVGTLDDHGRMLTVLNCPPDRCWATDLAMDGFSATQSTLGAIMSKLFGICHEGLLSMGV